MKTQNLSNHALSIQLDFRPAMKEARLNLPMSIDRKTLRKLNRPSRLEMSVHLIAGALTLFGILAIFAS